MYFILLALLNLDAKFSSEILYSISSKYRDLYLEFIKFTAEKVEPCARLFHTHLKVF